MRTTPDPIANNRFNFPVTAPQPTGGGWVRGLAAVLLLAGTLPAVADQTIYQDLFNDQQNINRGGPYTQSLGGSAPTTRNAVGGGSSGATWTYAAEAGGWGQRVYGNNGVATPTSSNYLPFTPQQGHLYQLSAGIDATASTNGEWFTIGFTSVPNNWTPGNYVADLGSNLVRGGQSKTISVTLDTRTAGWSNSQGLAYVGWFTDIPGQLNLSASQQLKIDNFTLVIQNPCTITYDTNGATSGSVPADGKNPYSAGATATVLGNTGALAKDGYSFAGWNTATDGSGTTYILGNTLAISGDTTLYALWSLIPTYSVIYNGNGSTGGSVPADGNPYLSDATVTVLGNTGDLTKTGGYGFLNWNTAADGSGTNYSAGETFAMGSANVTLYAQWTPPVSIVGTVNDSGGPVSGASVLYSTSVGGPFSSNFVTTATDGTFIITGVTQNSTYYVKAGALGHLTSAAETVSVGTGNATADFTLANSVIANGDFADNGGEYGGNGYSGSPNPAAPMFWTISGNGVGVNGAPGVNVFGPTTKPGSGYWVFMQSQGTHIRQALATAAGTTYQVSCSVAGRGGYPAGSIRIYVSPDDGTTDVGGLTINPVNTGSFQQESFYFTAPAATTLVVKNLSPAGDYTMDVRGISVAAVTLPIITGTVRAASGGTPISGATVYYSATSGGPYGTVTAASDGTYQVAANFNTTCYLKAGAATCQDSAETSVAVTTIDVGGIDFALAPVFVWNNGANTGHWNTTDANWNPWVWSNMPPQTANFTTVGGTVTLDTGITAGAVNVGTTSANFATLTLSGGSLNASGLTVQGSAATAGNYAVNPTLATNSDVSVTGDAAVGRANLTISGGTFTADRIISAAASADWANVTISGGTVTTANGIDGSVHTGATFQLNLNGGTLHTPSIKVADREVGTNNDSRLVFNGTTVKATTDTTNFVTLYGGDQNAYLSNDGAIFDTNGHHITVSVNLRNTSGQTGSLTQQGTGTLTLSGTNTYSGNTTVAPGAALVLAAGGSTRFHPAANGVSNKITGSGSPSVTLDGEIYLDLSGADTTSGNSWLLADAANLALHYGGSLSVKSSLGVFTKHSGAWQFGSGTNIWTFTEATGTLTLAGDPFTMWIATNWPGLTDKTQGGDPDSDGLSNLLEYAFGMDPSVSSAAQIVYDGTSVTTPGTPKMIEDGGMYYAVFGRRADYLAAGLTYTVEFSADLENGYWVTSTDIPEPITATGEILAVRVPYPGLLDSAQGPQKARFFRVGVSQTTP